MKTLTILLLSLSATAQTYTPTGDLILPRAQINIIANDLKLLPYVMQDNDSLRASVIELGTMLQDAEREFEKMRVALVEAQQLERNATDEAYKLMADNRVLIATQKKWYNSRWIPFIAGCVGGGYLVSRFK